MPMLFKVLPVTNANHINVKEWTAMYDKFCLMTQDELLRFAFYQLATVGKQPGQFPRIAVRVLFPLWGCVGV